jgi:hypothetical protein
VGEIDFGSDFVSIGAAVAHALAGRLGVGRMKMGAHLVGLEVFQRTGMGFLLGDSDCSKYIENRLALDLKFPGQIVDSNLAHPPFPSSGLSR